MSNIKKIRQEIEQLRREIDDHNYYLDNSEQALGYSAALDDIEKFLDTLSEEPDKSLVEAAEEYAEKHGFRVPYDGSENFYDDVDVKASKEGFIAGAKCQKQHDAELIEIAYNDGITIGMTKQKEQMMKEAVDGEVVQDLKGRFHVKTNAVSDILYQFGDKVKVIILKQ